jgi:outer membrane protein assembly factor BamB
LNTKKLTLISLLVLGSLILSACASGRGVSNNWHGVAADAERAYVSNGSYIYAVDLKNGKEIWHYPDKAGAKIVFFATPVLTADGQLLIGSAGIKEHPFLSLDPSTGKENWSEPFTGKEGPWLAAPLVFKDKIYAPNTNGYVYILGMDGQQAADPIKLGGALWAAPVTDGKLLYIASLNHYMHVIDPTDNSEVTDPIDLGGAIPSSPAVGSNGVYAGSFASTVEFIQSNGNHKVVATAGNWVWGSPILDGETLYYADLTGKVYSLDLASGNENWSVQPAGSIVAGLLKVGDQVYVASEPDPKTGIGTLVALDLKGKTVWPTPKEVGGKLYTTPVNSGDLILVAPYQTTFSLAAYDAQGNQVWAFTPTTTK